MSARVPSDPATLFARAIAGHAGGYAAAVRIGTMTARPWASATFEGERVEIELYDVEPDALWLAELPEAEIKVRRYFVADLVVHATDPSAVRIEALLLRDL